MYLTHPDLGRLDLDCGIGYVVAQYEIGFPRPREVVRVRPLDDGIIDDTAFVGERAVSVALRLDQRKVATQTLLDLLLPFVHPGRRPRLVWSVERQDGAGPCPPGTAPGPRSLVVRGADAPVPIAGPRFQTIVCQWIGAPFIESVEERCQTWSPGETNEGGRTYDLTFDRVYPASAPSGQIIVVNAGNSPAPWRLTIFGELEDPIVWINDRQITTDGGGGTTLGFGQTLVIDTLARTMRLDDDPADSVYNRSNFTEWEWSDLRPRPGPNTLRIQASNVQPGSAATICWRDTWL